MAKRKFNVLKIDLGEKSSRFIVDLKKESQGLSGEIGNKTTINKIIPSTASKLETKLEKLAEADYGRYFKTGREKSRAIVKKISSGSWFLLVDGKKIFKDKVACLSKQAVRQKTKEGEGREISEEASMSLADQLAFIALAKLIFWLGKKSFHLGARLCYLIGWLLVFCLRLIYFAALAVFKPLAVIFSRLFLKMQFITFKSAGNLWLGLQGTYLLLIASTARILNSLKNFFTIFKKQTGEKPIAAKNYYAPTLKKFNLSALKNWPAYLKPMLVFAGILTLIVLPVKAYTYYKSLDNIKGKVLGASEQAVSDLVAAGQSAANFNFYQADQGFAKASQNFLSAQIQLSEIDSLIFALASVVPNRDIRLAAASKNIVKAGELSSRAGKNLSLAMAGLFDRQNKDTAVILSDLSLYGHQASSDLIELNQELALINTEILEEGYQEKFILLKQKAVEVQKGLEEFVGLVDNLQDFLGAKTNKRYLLIFQNNAELRASGGFIGSFAIIDFANGKIKNIQAPGGGSYDTDAGLLKKIKSPEPLSLVRADWHFWDANWWPDWPTSARKLAWFYENSDGSTVDGVISFTPTVMEKLLKVAGPIDLKEKYGLEFNADNFWLETQKLAEQKPDVTKQPKKIIGDLLDKLIAELPNRLNRDNLIPILKIFEQSLSDKNILLYFTDDNLENKMAGLGWAGEIKDTASDYLQVVNTNIAGGKSDRKIKQEIIHRAEIQSDGTIIDNLTIKRTHQGIKREPFIGVRNVNWLRIYVPLGSQLLEANGFKPVDKIFFKEAEAGWQADPEVYAAESQASVDEQSGTKIYNELNKTVFANWSQLDPGQLTEITIRYRLPFKLTDKKEKDGQLVDQFINKAAEILKIGNKNFYPYFLLVQKQPGMNSTVLISELKLDQHFKQIWHTPADSAANDSGWYGRQDLNQDSLWAGLIEEKS